MSIETEGTYPIGKNGCWHGGIHKRPQQQTSRGEITPLFGGIAVTCKIQKTYYKSKLLAVIDKEEYDTTLDKNTEQEQYTLGEDGFYRSENPPEREYSTSYVLLKHKLTILTEGSGNSGSGENKLECNFFTLYMHIMPYGEWSTLMEDFGGLPFYLWWKPFTVKRTNRRVGYWYVDPGDQMMYDGTKLLLDNGRIFHHAETIEKNGLVSVKTVVGKKKMEDPGRPDIMVHQKVPAKYIQLSEPLEMRLKPAGNMKIRFYHPQYANAGVREPLEYYYTGTIRTDSGYTVGFKKEYEQNSLLRSKDLIKITFQNRNGNIVQDCPKGIVLNSKIVNGAIRTELPSEWLYKEQAEAVRQFKAVPVHEYIGDLHSGASPIEQNSYIAGLKRGRRAVEFEGEDCVFISRGYPNSAPGTFRSRNQNFNDIVMYNDRLIDNGDIRNILINDLTVGDPAYYNKNGSTKVLTLYKLLLQTKLYPGQRVKTLSGTAIRGFSAIQLDFPQYGTYEALAAAGSFGLAEDVVAGTLRIGSDYDSHRNVGVDDGIPCSDADGYIRGLLQDGDTFSLRGSGFSNGNRINITKIRGFDQDMECTVNYNENEMTLEGRAEIDSEKCRVLSRGKEQDICVLNPGYTKEITCGVFDTLGGGGNFELTKNFYHLETLFTDDALINDLFAGTYSLYTYFITKDTVLYEKRIEAGVSVYFPERMIWKVTNTKGGYSRIELQKLPVFFYSGDGMDSRGSWVVKEEVRRACFYDKVVAFKGEESTREGCEKYLEFLKTTTFTGKELEKDYLAESNWQLVYFDATRTDDNRIDLSALDCWIAVGDLASLDKQERDGIQTYTVPVLKSKAYTTYEKCPETMERSETRIEKTVSRLGEETGPDGEAYKTFTDNGTAYYIPKQLEHTIEKKNVLDWKQYFEKVEEDGTNDMFCDKINEVCEEEVVKPGDNGLVNLSSELRKKLENRVCKFPMEWNKKFYELCKEGADCRECGACWRGKCESEAVQALHDHRFDCRYAARYSEMMERADVWNEIKDVLGKDGNGDQNIWHVHPDYFKRYVQENLIREFNPYEGKPIDLGGKTVIDNPGFAPYTGKGPYNRYCVPNGFFNEDYTRIRGKPYNHEGVDFATGVEGTEIRALIHAAVIATGYRAGDYGNYILLRSVSNEKHFFLLGHLKNIANDIKQKVLVDPERVVGYVGNTGRSTGPHLHVSFIVADRVANIYNEGSGELERGLNDRMKNPFDYKISYEWAQ
jgi:hypothetical protein